MFDWAGVLIFLAVMFGCIALGLLFAIVSVFVGPLWGCGVLFGVVIVGGALAVGFSGRGE